MRHVSASVLLLSVLSSACVSADVYLPKPPDPVPAPMPSEASYALAEGDYLFIGADQPTLVRVSPANLVEWKEVQAGANHTHHWEFNGASKEYKTATAHAYKFKAVGKGRAEVEMFWAEGGKVQVRKITLDCQGARPPPVPPDPKPPEPDPVDPLAKAVKAAYDADPSASKYLDKSAVAAVCVAVKESLADVKTAGQLFQVVSGSLKARVGDRMRSVRDILGEELGKVLPKATTEALTDKHRVDAAAVLNRFADILAGVK